MSVAGSPIEAVLTLNATGFHTGLNDSLQAVKRFESAFSSSIKPMANDMDRLKQSLDLLGGSLELASNLVSNFSVNAKSLSQFSTYASSVNKLANALKILSSDTISAETSMNLINNMFKYFRDTLNGTEVKVKGVVTSIEQLTVAEEREAQVTEQVAVATKQYDSALTVALPKQRDMIINATGVASAMEKEAVATEKDAMAKQKDVNSTNQLSNANKGLSKTFGMLRNAVTLVGSMIAYNFIHKLGTATTETINAKSEMEGYFQMLHFSGSEIKQFNSKLDETVSKFQRINKYALGETISSIGVEFNLTTKEMEKAMPVVSMITSEYLRAGRNVNEASLAVKDILQGEFQRLSRETGVKGDQLKEAGWSGDKTDVMGLLEALDKVGKSRNWDIFVTKANSLNDAVLILQNRFSEWSADMVNVVQPTILAVFNNLMAFGQGASQSLSGMWKWLNTDSWGATATKIGLVTTAILTLMPSLVSLRSGAKLLEVANMGVTQSLGALVFGLNAETLATHTSSEAIGMKLLGIKAEELENTTLVGLINGMIVSRNAETVATDLATASNLGFTGGLTAMITGEAIAEGTTISLTGALGLLTGAFLTSPIGWFTLLVLGLASAFYVLTGGLDASWEMMHQFNETMRDTGSAQKEAYEWLEQVKKDAGENSEAFNEAKGPVDEYIHSLQSASYWYNHSQTAFNGLDLTSNTTGKDIAKGYGISDEEVEEWNGNLDNLSFGKERYYKAEQVLNKQLKGENSNFAKDLDDYLAKVQKNGGDLEEAYGKMKGNYDALAYHSYVANTTDSWWEWLWNSFYAGMDQFWIDWDKFWADPQWSDAIDGIKKIFGNSDGELGVGGVGSLLGLFGIEIPTGEEIVEWFSGIQDYLSSHSLMEIIGLDESHDYNSDINSFVMDGIVKPFGEVLYNGLKGIPLLNGILTLFETLTDEDIGATEKGRQIGEWVGNGLNEMVNHIPVLGQVKQMLELLGQSSDESKSKVQQNTTDITNSVISTTSTTSDSLTGMKDDHKRIVGSMVSYNKQAFDDMKNKNNTSLLSMRDSTSQTTHQMSGAWGTMKDSIIASAKKISDGTTAHFNTLGSNIKNFYSNLQNPANWSAQKVASAFASRNAGYKSWSRSPKPATARRLFSNNGKHGAGVNPYESSNKQMGIKDLVDLIGVNEKVDIGKFLSLFSGGFGGWDYSQPHISHIKRTAHQWRSAPAVIQGIGSVGNGYDVGRFVNNPPHFSFDEFLAVAESIFSTIPYKFYYDSEWKGSWVNALMSGAVNCSDGADALLALASVFGFSGEKIHTNLKNGTGHFYTRINGKTMDTTNFQNHGSWSALGGAGSPRYSRGAGTGGNTHNITIDMSNSNFYGMDDFKEQLRSASREVLREEFNDPYGVAL